MYNKIDVCSIEEVDAIARMPDSIPCSASQSLNMDGLLERMWDMMALVRVYTKRVSPLDQTSLLVAWRYQCIVSMTKKIVSSTWPASSRSC